MVFKPLVWLPTKKRDGELRGLLSWSQRTYNQGGRRATARKTPSYLALWPRPFTYLVEMRVRLILHSLALAFLHSRIPQYAFGLRTSARSMDNF